MRIKIINSYRTIVAVADDDLIGKKFEEGGLQLDVKENFYKSEKKFSEKEALEIIQDMMKEDATFNIVGEKSIRVALKSGVIDEETIRKVDGIPFALVLL